MNMIQCINGHFYDADRTATCPYCNPATDNMNRTIGADVNTQGGESGGIPGTVSAFAETVGSGATMPIMGGGNGFAPMGSMDDIGRTTPVAPPADDRKTMAVLKKDKGIDPVVGWLVCIEGAARGQDFRIHSGNNGIGRSSGMSIMIPGDDTISHVDMAFITYDSETKLFYVVAGKGKNVVRLNGQLLPVSQSQELKPYDRIKLGQTTVIFVPLCGEGFDWD